MTGKFYNNFKTAMLLGLLTALDLAHLGVVDEELLGVLATAQALLLPLLVLSPVLQQQHKIRQE